MDIAGGEGHGLKVGVITSGDEEKIEILGPLPSEFRRGLKQVAPFWEPVRRGRAPWSDYEITWVPDPSGDGPRFGISSQDQLIGLLGALRLSFSGRRVTAPYVSSGKVLLRPNKKMSTANHARVGDVLNALHHNALLNRKLCRNGIARELYRLKCVLDLWFMAEHGPVLSDEQYFDTYFGNVFETGFGAMSPAETYRHYAARLIDVKILIAGSYILCAPLMEVLAKIDGLIEKLEGLHDRRQCH